MPNALLVLFRRADLTQQFYSLYAKEHVLRREVKERWRELLSLPEEQQLMEKGRTSSNSYACDGDGLNRYICICSVITCWVLVSSD